MLFRSAVDRVGRLQRWLKEVVLGWAQRAVDYVLVYTIDFIGIYGFDAGQGGAISPKKALARFEEREGKCITSFVSRAERGWGEILSS